MRKEAVVQSLGPRTILQLVLLGLVLVALPLIAGLVTAVVQVERIGAESRAAVFLSGRAMQASRELVELATDMQRKAQQFGVLGDESLYALYLERRDEFRRAADQIERLEAHGAQLTLLDALRAEERDLHERLLSVRAGTSEVELGSELAGLARALLLESGRAVGEQARGLQSQAERAERIVLWQALALIPATLVFAAMLSLVIARPLRQIVAAIERLERGEFSEPIAIKGPSDLHALGQRLERLRQRLLALESQKVSFLRHVSHELKTPLTAIREGTELLADGVVGGLAAAQAEVVEILRENSLRLQQLIETLLRFSAQSPLEEGALGHAETVALDVLVERALDDHKLAVAAKALSLERSLEPLRVRGDPEQLRVVIDNLLSNAVKYAPRGGIIRLSLRRSDEHVILDVIDSGPGVDRAERERVFDAFYRGSSPASGQVQGTGLGLAIAREYVTLNHGTIEIVDDGDGGHFRVSLPLAPGA